MRVFLLLPFLLLLPAGASAQEVPLFDGERAFELLEHQVDLGPRDPGSEGHAACLDFLEDFLGRRAHRVSPHAFQVDDPYGEGVLRLTNLKASFFPERRRRIALAAHWDTRPRADRQRGGAVDEPIPGANDGASGVAVLLALSEILQERHPEGFGVDLLFFDGEDYGKEGHMEAYLLGSRRFVADHPGYRPEALILLDMVGAKGLSIPMEGNSLRYAPELTNRVFSMAADRGLDVFVPVAGRPILDDHVPFLQAGIPAVDLIDMDYRWWHTLEDAPDKCSDESLRQVGICSAPSSSRPSEPFRGGPFQAGVGGLQRLNSWAVDAS